MPNITTNHAITLLIDCIELAIFASFLRTRLPAKKHRESKTLKRYTNDQRQKYLRLVKYYGQD